MTESTQKDGFFGETERLQFRKMNQSDFPDLCKILQDAQVMKAYEGSFSKEEVQDWLDRQLRRYREDGFGLNAVLLGHVDTTAQRPSYSHIFRVSALIFLDIRQYACEKSP